MNRLEQDAADALAAYEFQQSERARWVRAQGRQIVGTWAPPAFTAQQQAEFEQYRSINRLPF